MGVSDNARHYYNILNSRILIVRTLNKVPLMFGNSHIDSAKSPRPFQHLQVAVVGESGSGKSTVAWPKIWESKPRSRLSRFGAHGLGLRLGGFWY